MSPKKVQDEVIRALNKVEKRASARLLPREDLEKLFSLVRKKPWGYAYGDGGHVSRSYKYPADTTYFKLAWFTWRKEKHVVFDIYREPAMVSSYGEKKCFIMEKSRREAYQTVFPKRAEEFLKIMKKRKIKFATDHLPPTNFIITEIFPDVGGIVLAKTKDGLIIGTPSGWLKAPWHPEKEKRSAWNYLKDMGFPVPHLKKNRRWNEDLCAFAIMHTLKGGKLC